MDERTHWRLCDLASAEIDALAGEGIACTPDEILRIQWLAQQVESPAGRLALARGTPVHVGGAVLWPLTMAADAWWRTAAPYAVTNQEQIAVAAFAMGHCRTIDGLESVAPDRAVQVAVRWLNGLKCRSEEVVTAILLVQEQDDTGPDVADPKQRGGGSAPGDVVAMLVAAVGGPPDVWERQVAIGFVRQQLEAAHAQIAAKVGFDAAAHRRIDATRNLGLAVEEIRQSRRAS
jgi:hypothetical protein